MGFFVAKSKSVVSVHVDIAALTWATRRLVTNQDWGLWGQSFVEALATQKPELNDFAAALIQNVVDFRANEAKRVQELREHSVHSVQDAVQTERKNSKSRELVREKEENSNSVADATDPYRLQFDEARKLYPGSKRGLETEFQNFKKKHRDWKEAVPLLLPNIQLWIKHREWLEEIQKKDRKVFIAQWKSLERWVNGRFWEETPPDEVFT